MYLLLMLTFNIMSDNLVFVYFKGSGVPPDRSQVIRRNPPLSRNCEWEISVTKERPQRSRPLAEHHGCDREGRRKNRFNKPAHKPGNFGMQQVFIKPVIFFSGFEEWALRKIPLKIRLFFSQRNMKL